MAEPFGIAASAIQVAGAGLSLAKTLHSYIDQVKSAQKHIKAIATEVKLTSSVLEHLGALLKKNEAEKLCTEAVITDAKDALGGCKDAFNEIEEAFKGVMRPMLSGARTTMSATARLAWPFKKGTLETLQANLERLKSTLLLMLSVLSYAREKAQRPAAVLSLQRVQIQNLIKAKNDATMRYEQLLVDMQKLNTAESDVAAASDMDARQKSDGTSAGRSRSPPSTSPQPAENTHRNPWIIFPSFADQTHTPPAPESRSPDSSAIVKQLGTCASAVSRLSSSISMAMVTCSTHGNLDIRQIGEPLKDVHQEVVKLKLIERQSASGEKAGSSGIVNNPPFATAGGYHSGYQSSLASSKEQLLREQRPLDVMSAQRLLQQQQQQPQMQNPNAQRPSQAPSNRADLPQAAIDPALEDSPKNDRDASEEPPPKRRKKAAVSAPAPSDTTAASDPKRHDKPLPGNGPISRQSSQGAQPVVAMQGQRASQASGDFESTAPRPEGSPRPAQLDKVIEMPAMNFYNPSATIDPRKLLSSRSPPFIRGSERSSSAAPEYPSPPAPSPPSQMAAPSEGAPDRKAPWDYRGTKKPAEDVENDEVDELVKRWTTVEV